MLLLSKVNTRNRIFGSSMHRREIRRTCNHMYPRMSDPGIYKPEKYSLMAHHHNWHCHLLPQQHPIKPAAVHSPKAAACTPYKVHNDHKGIKGRGSRSAPSPYWLREAVLPEMVTASRQDGIIHERSHYELIWGSYDVTGNGPAPLDLRPIWVLRVLYFPRCGQTMSGRPISLVRARKLPGAPFVADFLFLHKFGVKTFRSCCYLLWTEQDT